MQNCDLSVNGRKVRVRAESGSGSGKSCHSDQKQHLRFCVGAVFNLNEMIFKRTLDPKGFWRKKICLRRHIF